MAASSEVRRLEARWRSNQGWPKRLEALEIKGLRGWSGQRFEMRFPIMAVIGENGAGKSTVLQAAASVYRSPNGAKSRYASEFFPDTTWDKVTSAQITYQVREGNSKPAVDSVRKPGDRWLGNPNRRERAVRYIDLSRIQPVSARIGYVKLANPGFKEASARPFDAAKLGRFNTVMGRDYDLAKMALLDADKSRPIAVLAQNRTTYSGFHQGAGETTVAELLQTDLPKYSLLLIDEVESSLHPRAQRRLIRDLATLARELELQVILTTHSPYVIDELPLDARAYILQLVGGAREIIYGVSPELAMTKMDDVAHPEIDVYVEDPRAGQLFTEILVATKPELVPQCQLIHCGGSEVLKTLGQLIDDHRLPRASIAVVDGDVGPAVGCVSLPGVEAPERVIFERFKTDGWDGVARRIGRPIADVADACNRSTTDPDHHTWVNKAASTLVLGGDTLWQAMCAEWATTKMNPPDGNAIAQAVEDALGGISAPGPRQSRASNRPAFGGVETRGTGSGGSTASAVDPKQATLFEERST